jgi:CheY-like chemotaxis protein/signal transduction histidine kinase
MSGLKIRLEGVRKGFAELRRRKVIKVAGVYAVVAWLVIQIATQTFPALHLPEWAATLVIVLTILGFPIAIVLAWTLELTPGGVRPERTTDTPPAPATPVSQSTRAITRSGPVSPRTARPAPVPAAPGHDDAPAVDPKRDRRAAVARLRHDLRTPMNAILGYGSLLMMEAGELGIVSLAPDIQRAHNAAKKLLEQIDQLLPSGPEAGDVDISSARIRLHEGLLQPTAQIVRQSQELLAKAGTSERASADLERQLRAAQTLFALVEKLAAPPVASSESAGPTRFEQTFSRLHPGVGQARETLHAGTLLIVDDDAMNRDVLTRQLVREGYSVFTAASGKDGLEQLRLHDFDLVLLDVMMPGMDGVEVLEHIRNDPSLRGIPVVMISAFDEIDGVVRCIERGAADYLAKPFDPLLLRTRVAAPLQIHQLTQDLRRAEDELIQNRASIDALLRSVAPRPLAEGVKRGERTACAHYSDVTAVVAQIDGVDAIAARCGPEETIERVNETLSILEQCSRTKDLEFVRAAERCYTAIVGAPEWQEDHAEEAAEYALRVLRAMEALSGEATDRPTVRIGVNTGALTAGVAGGDRLIFGMWGDAVSTADAIARQAPAGRIYVSAATCARLKEKFDVGSPGTIEVPGHGHLRAYLLTGRKLPAAVP